MFIAPQTIKSEIIDKLNALVGPGVFLPLSDHRMVEIAHDIRKLARIDPEQGKIAQAMLLQLNGDEHGALSLLDEVSLDTTLDRLCVLMNFNRASLAQNIYQQECGPSTHHFMEGLHYGIGCGAIHQTAHFLCEAEKMNYQNISPDFKKEVNMARDLFLEFGVSDAEVASLIETAGSVITHHGFMFVGEGPDIDVFDIPGELRAVHYTYRLPVTPARAVDLYIEFIDCMVAKEQTFPVGFHIAFGGAIEC